MSHDLTCPYCEEYFEASGDDDFGYEQDTAHEQECPHCEKTFIFYTHISCYYNEYKADCLNDAPHDWDVYDYSKDPYMSAFYKSRKRCKSCGKEESEHRPPEEANKMIKEWEKEHESRN